MFLKKVSAVILGLAVSGYSQLVIKHQEPNKVPTIKLTSFQNEIKPCPVPCVEIQSDTIRQKKDDIARNETENVNQNNVKNYHEENDPSLFELMLKTTIAIEYVYCTFHNDKNCKEE